jgi:hypothetical protein
MEVKTSVKAGQPGPVHGGPIKWPWWPEKPIPCGGACAAGRFDGSVNSGPFGHPD